MAKSPQCSTDRPASSGALRTMWIAIATILFTQFVNGAVSWTLWKRQDAASAQSMRLAEDKAALGEMWEVRAEAAMFYSKIVSCAKNADRTLTDMQETSGLIANAMINESPHTEYLVQRYAKHTRDLVDSHELMQSYANESQAVASRAHSVFGVDIFKDVSVDAILESAREAHDLYADLYESADSIDQLSNQQLTTGSYDLHPQIQSEFLDLYKQMSITQLPKMHPVAEQLRTDILAALDSAIRSKSDSLAE